MMRLVFNCDTCGAETNFCVNSVPYCADHAMEGIGVQARLTASLRGADSDEVAWMGEFAQRELAAMWGITPRE